MLTGTLPIYPVLLPLQSGGVFNLGKTTWQELVARDINAFGMHSGLSQEDFGWGSPSFHKMVSAPQPLSLRTARGRGGARM